MVVMAIDLYWDDAEQTVILAEFNKQWSWDDLYTMLNTVKRLSKEKGRVFGAIVDVRDGFHLPGGSIFNQQGLDNFRKILTMNDGEQKGPVVVLGMNSMVRSVFNAVSTFDKSLISDVQFADTMEEAQQLIYVAVRRLHSTTS
jgi:hypothetical protein